VPAPGLGHRAEARQAVADDLAVRIKAPLRKAGYRAIAEAGHPSQLQPHRLALRRGLDGRHEWRLARRAAAPFAARALATEIGIVDLHPPDQALAGIALHHHLRQLVLQLPGRGLGHTKAATQFKAGDALLALGHVIHGAEPQAQRHVRGGKDGAGDQRGLAATGAALKQPARFHLAVRLSAAGRALEAIRPA